LKQNISKIFTIFLAHDLIKPALSLLVGGTGSMLTVPYTNCMRPHFWPDRLLTNLSEEPV